MENQLDPELASALRTVRQQCTISDRSTGCEIASHEARQLQADQWLKREVDPKQFLLRPTNSPETDRLKAYIRSAIQCHSDQDQIQQGMCYVLGGGLMPVSVARCTDDLLDSLLFVAELEGEANAHKALLACTNNNPIQYKVITIINLMTTDSHKLDNHTSVMPVTSLPELSQLLVSTHSGTTGATKQFQELPRMRSSAKYFSAIVSEVTGVKHFPKNFKWFDYAYTEYRDKTYGYNHQINFKAITALSLVAQLSLWIENTWIVPRPAQLLTESFAIPRPVYDPRSYYGKHEIIGSESQATQCARRWLHNVNSDSDLQAQLRLPLSRWLEVDPLGDHLRDQTLNLAIALDAMYVGDDEHSSGKCLGKRFAEHMGRNDKERCRLYTLITTFYKYRSQFIHGRHVLTESNYDEVEDCVNEVREACASALLDFGINGIARDF